MRVTKKPSLAETHPDLAAQADGWDPRTVGAASNSLRRWRCSAGHEYRRTIRFEVSNSGECPECLKPRPIQSIKELAPHFVAEAVGWDPAKRSIHSKSKVPWMCSNGHRYQERIDHRIRFHFGCPKCRVNLPDTAVSIFRPDLVKHAHLWDPTSTLASESISVMWKCKRNHHFSQLLAESLNKVFTCWKCYKLKSRIMSIGELASELNADKKEFFVFAKQIFDEKMTPYLLLTIGQVDHLLDLWLEDKRNEAEIRSSNQDNGYPIPEMILWQREYIEAHSD